MDKYNHSALYYAIKNNNKEIINLLLTYGAIKFHEDEYHENTTSDTKKYVSEWESPLVKGYDKDAITSKYSSEGGGGGGGGAGGGGGEKEYKSSSIFKE